MQSSKIPKTGKIGNLAKNIEKEINQSLVLEVMQNVDQFESASNRAEKAEWIKEAIKRLEQQVGKGRSKNYYCIAVTIFEIEELKKALTKVKKNSIGSEIIGKSKIFHSILDKIAERGQYYLKLRK